MESLKKEKVRMHARPSVLNRTNPELFNTKPRAGGLLVSFRKEHEQRGDVSKVEGYDITLDVFQTTSRDYRLTSALEDSNWSLEGSDMTEDLEFIVGDPLKNCIEMLCVTISTIMFLAADSKDKMSKEQIKWAIQYLRCIRDEFGNTPPNAQGILNHLKHLYNNDLSMFEDQPAGADGSGQVHNETEVGDMSKTERCVTTVTHQPEDGPPEAAPEAAAAPAENAPEAE